MDDSHLADQAGQLHVGHLPFFITPPGHTDVLLIVVGVLLALGVLGLGALFLTIHSLPERIAHRSKKLQLEIVAVLCLLALLTHEHLFWVVALVLALVDLPDISTPVKRMAAALERMSGLPPEGAEPSAAPIASHAGDGAATVNEQHQPKPPSPAAAAAAPSAGEAADEQANTTKQTEA